MCHVFQRNRCKVRDQTASHGKHFCSIHWHKCTRQLTSSETRQKKKTLICTGGIRGTCGLSSNEVMTKKRSPAHFCMTHMWTDSLFFFDQYIEIEIWDEYLIELSPDRQFPSVVTWWIITLFFFFSPEITVSEFLMFFKLISFRQTVLRFVRPDST